MARAKRHPDGRFTITMKIAEPLSVLIPFAMLSVLVTALVLFFLVAGPIMGVRDAKSALLGISICLPALVGSLALYRFLSSQTWEFDRAAPVIRVKRALFTVRSHPLEGLVSLRFEDCPASDDAARAYLVYADGTEVPVTGLFSTGSTRELREFVEAANAFLDGSWRPLSRKERWKKELRGAGAAVSAILLGLLLSLVWSRLGRPTAPFLGAMPPLQKLGLYDQASRTLDDRIRAEDGESTAWIVGFLDPSRPERCPRLVARLQGISAALGRRNRHLRFVLFLLEPGREGKGFAAAAGIPQDWYLLSAPAGDRAKMVALARDYYRPAGGSPEQALESERLVLVDVNGIIRGYYGPNDDARLANEVPEALVDSSEASNENHW
jgi:hypothetical protein